jgi:hypothetical protein
MASAQRVLSPGGGWAALTDGALGEHGTNKGTVGAFLAYALPTGNPFRVSVLPS